MNTAAVRFHTFRFRAMNTSVEIAMRATEEAFAAAQSSAIDWFRYVEERFSRFRQDSELSRLNEAAGKHVLISSTMLEVLEMAQRYTAATKGAFDPFVLRALEEAGYSRSFEQIQTAAGERGTTSAAETAEQQPQTYLLDRGMKSVLLPAGRKLDLGGLVKSWATSRLAQYLRTRLGILHGLVNAGGDLTTWGTQTAEGLPWLITPENPWDTKRPVGTLRLEGSYTAAATSSTLGRSWNTADRGPQHHLIDPVTMRPSCSDVVQCTVAGPEASDCEIWAKTICITGLQEGVNRMREQAPACEALIFTTDGQMHLLADIASLNRRWTVPGAVLLQPEANPFYA